MRARRGLALLTVVLAAALGAASAARAGTELIVTGHGWGHGVGMSQWGAYGYARHGWSYRRILSHYYPGTQLGRSGEPHVRVLLVQGAGLVTIGCAAQIEVTNGRYLVGKLPAKTYGIGPKLALPLQRRHGPRPFSGLAEFSCARATLTLDGRPYHGTFTVRSNGRTVSVVNGLDLDTYVQGVVPSESPARWPLAELEAQAVAARSYAVAELKPKSPYDLLPDTRDQVYGGAAAERPRSNLAVAKTRAQILMWDGSVARTYYSSSSGGRTESVQDAWPGAAPIPYLRSVSDPYDTYSPHHDWGPYGFSGLRLAARLGLGGSVVSTRIERDSSWRVSSVALRLASGAVVRRSGDDIARALGLRSTWFSIGELELSESAARVRYGDPVRLTARAVGAKGAVLAQRAGDGSWRTMGHVGHGLALSVVPRAGSTFRLALPGTSGTTVAVAVTPLLRVEALGPHLLGGEVQPHAAGPVEVWRLERGAWKLVSRPRLLPNGEFRTPLRLRPTLYRITAGGDGALAPTLRRLRVTRSLLASLRH